MKRQNYDEKYRSAEEFSWFDCIGNIDQQPSLDINEKDQLIQFNSENFQQLNVVYQENILNQYQQKSQTILTTDTYNQQVPFHPSQFNKIYLKQQNERSLQNSKQSQNKSKSYNQQKTNQKQDKQYSKVYRERKKQFYKSLQQENQYLKKRISDLEYRLRQQQIELNRFKYPPPQKQLTMDQFRRQFLQRTVLVLNQHRQKPNQQSKIVYTPQDPFYHEFLDMYAQRGFAGNRKMKLLKYHFDQIFQTILKDSQRYLTLVFTKSRSGKDLQPIQEYAQINAAFYQVFKLNQDLENRLKYFVDNLYPLHLQLTQYCSDFHKAFQNIQTCSKKIHNFINQTYLTNMDVARKRIQLETWFQFHKYGKLLRRLRAEWFDLIKQGGDKIEKQKKKYKKTKLTKTQS